MRVVVYQQPTNRRSGITCAAMLTGIRRLQGPNAVKVISSAQYVSPQHDVAVFYGLHGRLTSVMAAYSKDPQRRAVYMDLGYFGRREGGKLFGYHKISVDSRHPTAYFQNRQHSDSRWKRFKVKVRDWRPEAPNSPIILAGMGPKGASFEGYNPGEWEAEAVRIMRKHTARPIIYRPKPNWPNAPQIPGATYTRPDSIKLDDQIRGAHAIVSHHSNANIEAMVLGVPSFTEGGVGSLVSLSDLAHIETPYMPAAREQFLADLAYTQWSVSEMADGQAWRYLRDEGLVP